VRNAPALRVLWLTFKRADVALGLRSQDRQRSLAARCPDRAFLLLVAAVGLGRFGRDLFRVFLRHQGCIPEAVGDLFEAIKAGKASVVTDRIESFTERGISLSSGDELDADLIVTATGITLQLFGGAEVEVDHELVVPSKTVGYKGAMLSGVPNFAFTVGYVNASWTLRAETTSQYVCEVLRVMDEKGCTECRPRTDPGIELDRPVDLSSGYFQRSIHILPQRGKEPPWRAEQDCKIDRRTTLEGPIDDGILEFAKSGQADPAQVPALEEALATT